MSQSGDLFAESSKYIPGGVNSPVRAFRAVAGDPVFFAEGKGKEFTDVDGKTYLDFCNSWGPLILGHADEDVSAALSTQLKKGTSYGAPTEVELALAKLVVESTPAEQIRFVSSGTEAAMSAIRLARGVTGKNRILKFNGCYHGHADSLLVKGGSGLATFGTASSAGVPPQLAELTISVPLGNVQFVEDALNQYDDIAAVLIEGVPANNGLLIQTHDFMTDLANLCKSKNVLLLMDEVITGFRLGMGGASAHYGIEPDLVCYGKVIGGGMPVGAFGASKEVMDQLAPNGPVYQAGTLSGNPMAMAGGLATLRKLKDGKIHDHLENLGSHLESRWAEVKPGPSLVRVGSIFWMYGGGGEPPKSAEDIDAGFAETYKNAHRKLLDAGLYLAPSAYEVGFLSAPMVEADIDRLVDGIKAAFN